MIPIQTKPTRSPAGRGDHGPELLLDGPLAARPGRSLLQPPGLSEPADPMALLRALKRRWPLALILGLVAAGATAAVLWFVLAAPFRVYGQLHFAASQPRLLFQQAYLGDASQSFQTYLRTQAMQVKSRWVINGALKRDDVRNLALIRNQVDPALWLEEELKVEQTGTEILTIALTHREFAEATTIVNALLQVFLQEVNNNDQKRRADRLAELEDIHNHSKEKLRQKRATLQRLIDDAGSQEEALAQRQANLTNNLEETKRHHSQIKLELLRASSRLAPLNRLKQDLDGQTVADDAIEAAVDADATVAKLLDRLDRLDALVREYERTAARPTEHSLVVARREHADTRSRLEERRKTVRAAVADQARKRRQQEMDAQIQSTQQEIAFLQEQEKFLANEVAKLSVESGKAKTTSSEFEVLRGEIEQEEKMAKRVGEEIDALQVELRSPSRVTLYQEAVVQRTSNKKQLAGVVGGPVAALALVALGLGWWEHRLRRVRTAEEVAFGLGIRVLGSVPDQEGVQPEWLVHPEKAPANHDLEIGLEAVDSIRTVLSRDPTFDNPRVLMVAGANRGDGKTMLALQLALSFAETGVKTLLIDGDLRSPAIHEAFGAELEPGLGEVLRNVKDVADVICPTDTEGLFILPAGGLNADVLRQLARNGMKKVLDNLRGEFEYIVIDSHAVMAATDALLIGQDADAVILSVLKDVSQGPKVYAACRRLRTLDIRVLGAIINGMCHEKMLVS